MPTRDSVGVEKKTVTSKKKKCKRIFLFQLKMCSSEMKGVEHNKPEGGLEISYQHPCLSPFVSPLILSHLSFLPQVLVVLSVHSQEKTSPLNAKFGNHVKFSAPENWHNLGLLGLFWGEEGGVKRWRGTQLGYLTAVAPEQVASLPHIVCFLKGQKTLSG